MTAVPAAPSAAPTAQAPAKHWHQSAKTLNALLELPAEMELRQIELIYRAEGNANLVLALPQFKKVLRLPKMISSRQQPPPQQQKQAEGAEETEEIVRPEEQSDPTAGARARASTVKAGDLTMPDFMAYIGIMCRLLGNEFVCGADIVAIPKEDDRFWINEHIRAHRPVARLDKEFVGPFGLLLPDVTQLPATFDVLLGNLQAKGTTGDGTGAAGTGAGPTATARAGTRGVHRLGDTYAIEIKPKQGWHQLASDVNDLFDLMPAGAETMPKRSRGEKDQEAIGVEKATRAECRCRYCGMQLLKLRNGKIKRLGDYCPLELFSGAPSRMLDALHALLACPQNNLRVFQDGNLIYGDHANSISFDELHSRVFPGEIMVLIKHLLVACLLREYSGGVSAAHSCDRDRSGSQSQSHSRVSIGEMETRAGAGVAAGIGAANVARAEDADAEKWHADSVNAGQSSRRTRAAAEKPTTQRYTQPTRIEVETTAGAVSQQQCGNVFAVATQTETKTETETQPTPSTCRNENQNQNENENQREEQINKAEIFRLPKNCVLQKILNLQLLVKHHFDYMWRANYARHSRPTYDALRGLLALPGTDELQPEQAYLLGATALDCSIMLTFQEVEIDCESDGGADQDSRSLRAELLQPWLVSLLGHHFLTKLSVLDLDPKPDSHFHKFIEQTCEIEKCCRALN
ncbi:inositol-pentakisphosphate 2-kinase isoform X1 [Drosophila miranda]|uniref:inositol-pentakisphosphate 2-kinase isoform X1 n=1 Tax=Drosophila miranda TaxID=7229 RepID=UPI0007E85F2A|nr:inositol-pentakisphosphate 2-kinase isoform X1 [Drosophila miranda]XP_017149123.1 inositol-pentakisphosphate 2-kinase isoform X1 [Drosophila miranda]XP_017149124.1 inositol-pentakisphosphate 2-kinase isoform X1 [Drosophila miranda]XP_017149125.1 inositol-pentakisphosphate 2-kinase isoform X1 [Drosophila miranda]XP_017149126.1 inositol-pentakisphosphate 2-kinase isoform X1 [Drosophila miranda]XP_017149127.1 inositol-pentakisphosphate 2-kinase isoform X1 [Drosophila miranda]XP_017149128.1 in